MATSRVWFFFGKGKMWEPQDVPVSGEEPWPEYPSIKQCKELLVATYPDLATIGEDKIMLFGVDLDDRQPDCPVGKGMQPLTNKWRVNDRTALYVYGYEEGLSSCNQHTDQVWDDGAETGKDCDKGAAECDEGANTGSKTSGDADDDQEKVLGEYELKFFTWGYDKGFTRGFEQGVKMSSTVPSPKVSDMVDDYYKNLAKCLDVAQAAQDAFEKGFEKGMATRGHAEQEPASSGSQDATLSSTTSWQKEDADNISPFHGMSADGKQVDGKNLWKDYDPKKVAPK